MRRSLIVAPALAGLVCLGLAACPPYFAIDAGSQGQLHDAIGHHPVWAPPGPDDVCVALRARQVREGRPVTLTCPPSPGVRPRLVAQVNRIRAAVEVVGVLLAATATTTGSVLWQRARRSRSTSRR